MKKPPPTLRERIIANMSAIMDLMDVKNREFNDDEDEDEDFRPEIVRVVKQIADLELMPASEVRKAIDAVVKNVRRLELSIAKLPPNLRHLVKVEAQLAEVRRGATEITKADRKYLAADLTSCLIYNLGGYYPTLAKDGPYVKLTGLIYFTATGEVSKLESYCSKLYADLLRKEGNPYTDQRGPRRRYVPDAAAELIYQRRAEAAKNWPPLEQMVDDSLAKNWPPFVVDEQYE